MRAISAIFKPEEKARQERLKQVEALASEVARHIKDGMKPRSVILLAGTRLVFAMPKTANCQRVLGLKSAMLVGSYDGASDPERIKQDLEATLTEYYDGRQALPAKKG
jgi:hypothetical protein